MKRFTVVLALLTACSPLGSTVWSAKAATSDHPLDPQKKILQHCCVEAPVAQNLYCGSVTLDGKGEAMIALPPYFDALNANAQYILTPIGAAMPNLHVMQKMHENRFWIAGGAPAGEVSWMVIAQRKNGLKPEQAAENQTVNTTAAGQ